MSIIATVILLLASSSFALSKKDPRVRRVEYEIDEISAILSDTTNQTENALWEKRLDLARKELVNVERLVELEKREQALATQRSSGSDHALREALNSVIQVNTNDSVRGILSLKSSIRRRKSERADLEAKLKAAVGDSEDSAKSQADFDSEIKSIDALILSLSLERAAIELQIRVTDEVERIEDLRSRLDLNPKPTIGLIMMKRRDVLEAKKGRDEYALLEESLVAQREETATALTLATERFEHLDEEIELLNADHKALRARTQSDLKEKKLKLSRLQRMLSQRESEKRLMAARADHVRDQSVALDSSIATARQGRELLAAEYLFLQNDLSILRRRYLARITFPVVLIALLVFLYGVISRRGFPLFIRKEDMFVAQRMGRYVLFLLILTVLVLFFLEDLRAIATVLGIVGAAIVIALQDLCSSFAGWFVIVASGKLKMGDRVEIDGQRGDVIDIQMLRTTLLELNNWLGVDEPTGRIMIVPNSFIFKSKVLNYSHIHRYIWGKIDITTTFETPPSEARDLLLAILKEETSDEFMAASRGEEVLEEKYGLRHTDFEPKIHTVIGDSGVCFSVFYVSHYRKLVATRDRIVARILDAFHENPRMQFAYPTERHIPTPPAEEAASATHREKH
jgi:small-conductance mechanosensitive channel